MSIPSLKNLSQPKKHKTTHILGIIFLILVGIALVSGSLFGDKEVDEGYLYKLNKDKITKLEILRGGSVEEGGEMIFLNKEAGGDWTTDGAPADMVFVEAMLSDLENLKVKKEPVSENVEKQVVYEVDTKSREIIAYYGDSPKADFYIGKYGTDYNSNYIRKKESNKVYLTLEKIGTNFSRDSYKEMMMLSFNKDDATELSVKYDDTNFTIVKFGDEWKADDKVLDKTKVEEYLMMLGSFRGQEMAIVEDDADTGLDEPPLEITVILADGTRKTLTVGLGYPKVASYYAKTSDQAQIYAVSQWQRDDLKKTVEDFE